MLPHAFSQRDSMIHRLDPRSRLLAAVVLSVPLALADRPAVIGGGLALAGVLAALARLPLAATLRRLMTVNLFMAVLVVLLPLSVAGEPLAEWGPLAYSREGLQRALGIAVKANAVVLLCTALLSTMTPFVLGHALDHLRAPHKLIVLLIITVRYLETIHDEYTRLRCAMRVRCFRPRSDWRTLRTLAELVAMLLVRSLDRSERVLAAMKCRGWAGRFWIHDHFHYSRRDAVFAAAVLLATAAIGYGQWISIR